MLRSRGARPGRFQSSPTGPCAYFSRAGATIRTSSGVSLRPATLGCCASADDEAMRKSDARVAARGFIVISERDAPGARSPFVARSVSPVLLVGDLFHPLDVLAVDDVRDCDMAHRVGRCRSGPMLHAWRRPDDI